MAIINSTENPVSSTGAFIDYNVTMTTFISNWSLSANVTEGITPLYDNVTEGIASLYDNVTVGNISLYDNVTVGNTSLYDNVTEGLTSDTAAGASIVSPIVMFLTGLLGNVLALVVLHKTRTEIRSVMFYTLVAALTWNDLVGICLTSPPVLAAYLNHRHMPALDSLCRFHALAMVCFGLSTPFIVCTMAIERSLALKCSYFYSKYCTPTAARIVVALLWAFVLFFGSLPLLGVGAFTLQYPKTWCFLHFRSYIPLDMAYASAYAILNLLVVVVMVFCNGLVMTTLCRVRKSRRRMSNASVNSTLLNTDAIEEKVRAPQHVRRRHHRDVELQMIWLLCAITTIFSVCWVPLMVYILFCLQSPNNHSPVFGLIAVRLASLNQTLNPWIYVILRKSLLSRLAHLCRSYCDMCRLLLPDSTAPVSLPRRPTQFHNPRICRQPLRDRDTSSSKRSVKSSPNHKYVHVRNQLCPSSHFVNHYTDSTGSELRQGSGRLGVKGKKGGKKGSQDTGSRGKYSHDISSVSHSDQGWRTAGSSNSSAMCTRCRGVRPEHKGAMDGKLYSLIHPHPLSAHTQLHMTSPDSSTTCDDGSTEEGRPLLPLPADGIYVDLFPHLPTSNIPGPDDVTHNDVSMTSYRSQSGRGEAASAKALSFVSEADDHGYGSKVSTDSSRMSTPEGTRPDHRLLAGETDLSSLDVHATRLPTAACKDSDRGKGSASGMEGILLRDLKENRITQRDSCDDTARTIGSGIRETLFCATNMFLNSSKDNGNRHSTGNVNENYESQNSCKEGTDRRSACDLNYKQFQQIAFSKDTDEDVCYGSKENHSTSVKANLLQQKQGYRDDSFDVTSGVFDCREDDDVFDDCGDDVNDDDVYDDSVVPVAARREAEEGECGQGRKRGSSSGTVSTSSAVARLDSASGHDTATVLHRHCSSSSGH